MCCEETCFRMPMSTWLGVCGKSHYRSNSITECRKTSNRLVSLTDRCYHDSISIFLKECITIHRSMGCFYTSIIMSVAFKVTADGPSVKTQIFNQCDSILHFFEPQRPWKTLMQLPGKLQSTWLSPLKYFLQTTPLPHILIYQMSFIFEGSQELSLKARYYCNRNMYFTEFWHPLRIWVQDLWLNPSIWKKQLGLLTTIMSFSLSQSPITTCKLVSIFSLEYEEEHISEERKTCINIWWIQQQFYW